MPASPPVLTERRGAVQIITFNRPKVANAMDAEGSYLVDRFVRDAEADPRVGAIVLTGAGDRAFCSGMDLKEAARTGPGRGLVPGAGFCGVTERVIEKPVIGAINGAAVAGGFEIALACDMLVASDHAVFGLPEVKRGMVAFTGGVQRLAQQLPRQFAMEIVTLGRLFPAERMQALGVVNRTVPRGQLMQETLCLAEAMLENAWDTIAFAKDLFNRSMDEPLGEAIARGHADADRLMRSEASKEGIKAYAEHRTPQFRKEEPQ